MANKAKIGFLDFNDERRYILEETSGWPHAFMKFRVPMEQLFQEHPSNHLQVVAGDYVAGLVEICEKLGIGYKVQDKNLEYENIT